MDKIWIIIGTCITATLLFIVLVCKSPKRAGTWLSLYGAALLSLSVYLKL